MDDLKELEALSTEDIIKWAYDLHGDKIAIASSFGAEDVVLIDIAQRIIDKPRVFTLDTGRLHQETYKLIDQVRKDYQIDIEVFFPNYKAVEEMVKDNGLDLFYKGIKYRKLCCKARKIDPLKRALTGLKGWICGLRKEQSQSRTDLKKIEIDEANNGIIKINPLIGWSIDEIWNYIQENKVPYNPLHDEGYPSIGCEPCTRAIQPGEDVRAGRWWWENPEQKECGIHVTR